MKFFSEKAAEYTPATASGAKIEYMAIAAHHDDIEIMAADGILRGYREGTFYGVVTTDGGGSARSGPYADFTDEQMKKVRIDEQKKAADIGRYNGLALLNYSSAEVKMAKNPQILSDFAQIIVEKKPKIIYTHNICDKHPTHIGVAVKVIEAVRSLPKAARPERLYGCEVWRGLDWLDDKEKVYFDLSGGEELLEKLLSVFDSQIAGGKRYDLATAGRRRANATYAASHSVDAVTSMGYAMDLTPLIEDDGLDVTMFALRHIERFRAAAEAALSQSL